MANRFRALVVMALMYGSFGVAGIAHADPVIWDLVGHYEFGYGVNSGSGILSLDITSQDLPTGTFDATGAINAAGTYIISNGHFDGSLLSFNLTGSGYDSLGHPLTCYDTFTGTISSSGTFSGSMSQDCGHGPFYGLFSTTIGHASQIAVPEPASLTLLCLGLAGLGFSRRKIQKPATYCS